MTSSTRREIILSSLQFITRAIPWTLYPRLSRSRCSTRARLQRVSPRQFWRIKRTRLLIRRPCITWQLTESTLPGVKSLTRTKFLQQLRMSSLISTLQHYSSSLNIRRNSISLVLPAKAISFQLKAFLDRLFPCQRQQLSPSHWKTLASIQLSLWSIKCHSQLVNSTHCMDTNRSVIPLPTRLSE